ncbi:hypothetical protein ACFYN5_34515 [Streptomyces sp. NPDC007126]|uniref:hypothetical protein n=1 Tax=Streptomyces sp. NPDC007126 TaxID=3364774 RepID=UPI003687B3C9
MSRPLNVLVLDDDVVTSMAPLHQFVDLMDGDNDRFVFRTLTDPQKLDGYLDEHREIDVVLVDVAYDRAGPERTLTCLTAFDTLIRRNGPKGIGLAQSQYGRTLFPFAVCQLLPPPAGQIVVGWTYKDDSPVRGYPETIRILDEIAAGRGLRRPRTLRACMPDVNQFTGNFINTILASQLDVRLWELMSISHYSQRELHLTAGTHDVKTVQRRMDAYLKAIWNFQTAMDQDEDGVHPMDGHAALGMLEHDGRDARHRAVETFAQLHRAFFQAPELEDLVKERGLRESRRARRRRGRREGTTWWKANVR